MNFNPLKNPIDIIRLAFWLGAATDGLAIIPMLFPDIGMALFGGDPSGITESYRYAMGIGASLMAGWTVLLFWGALKPIERRAILLITLFPVVTGIVASSLYASSMQIVQFERVKYLYMHLTFLSVLFLWSYYIAVKQADKRREQV